MNRIRQWVKAFFCRHNGTHTVHDVHRNELGEPVFVKVTVTCLDCGRTVQPKPHDLSMVMAHRQIYQKQQDTMASLLRIG